MKRMIIAVTIGWLLGACLARCAHAESWFQFEAGMGAADYTLTDGKWFQDGALDNHVVSHAPAVTVGITGALIQRGAWGIDWHADGVYLGSVSASCRCTISDADYSISTKTVTPGAVTESYYGSGHAVGVALMLEPYYAHAGWKFGAAGGVFGYRKTWTENVSGWAGNFGSSQPIPVHLESAHGVSFAPAIGADISHGDFTLSYRYYFTSRNQGNTPPLWDDVQTLSVIYKF